MGTLRPVLVRELALPMACAAMVCALGTAFAAAEKDAKPAAKLPETTLTLADKVSMKLVLIPAGKFMFGSPAGEPGRVDWEGPQREVTISKPFYMGVTHVTQEQYQAVMGKNPSKFKGPADPVEMVSWNDSVEFCKKVSEKSGKKVRLPTEAEWEYACRAGTKTAYSFGDSEAQLGDYAWVQSNSGGTTHPVAQKKPNPFGLYDMHGNVCQWCSDWFRPFPTAGDVDPKGPDSGVTRILRGGWWDDHPTSAHCAPRRMHHETDTHPGFGFRVVMEAN